MLFETDSKTQDAVVRNLEIIGEATKLLSHESRSMATDVPWQRIARMRDRLIHHYFGVDLALVFETASRLVPELASRVLELRKLIAERLDP